METPNMGILPQGETESQQPRFERRWLDVGAVAELLGVHPVSIYRLCYAKKLVYYKPSGVGIRIDRRDVDRFMDAARVTPRTRKSKF